VIRRRFLLPVALFALPLGADAGQQIIVGGMPPVTMSRKPTSQGHAREFTSITLLPGRGLNTFQITASLPGRGETELLRSPSLQAASEQMNERGEDAFGNLNHSFGGAFLIPFTSRAGGELSDDKKLVTVRWHDKEIRLPNDYLGHYSVHGLINTMKAEDVRIRKSADGQTLTAIIHAGNFNGYWLSKTDIRYRIELRGDAIDIRVTATNIGVKEEPMGLGWHPFLRILSGDRSQARVHLPAARYGVVDTIDGRPTGELRSVEGTANDYRSALGALMPNASTSVNFSKIERTAGSIDAWLSDPKTDYAIRVRGLSPEIQTLHLWSAKDDTFCAIEAQYNYMDAFGTEWHGMDTGMVTLKPGESTEWHVRLELFDPPAA
jgi:galactose mutarotase-like enzyme